jgi:hypothetical protein
MWLLIIAFWKIDITYSSDQLTMNLHLSSPTKNPNHISNHIKIGPLFYSILHDYINFIWQNNRKQPLLMNFYKMANPFSLMTITKHFVCKFLDKIHTYF